MSEITLGGSAARGRTAPNLTSLTKAELIEVVGILALEVHIVAREARPEGSGRTVAKALLRYADEDCSRVDLKRLYRVAANQIMEERG